MKKVKKQNSIEQREEQRISSRSQLRKMHQIALEEEEKKDLSCSKIRLERQEIEAKKKIKKIKHFKAKDKVYKEKRKA